MEWFPGPVDVAAFESEQFGGTQPGQAADDRDRPVVGEELVGDCLHFGETREREHLGAFRLRVRDLLRRVRVEQPDGDGVAERLPQRLDDVPGRTRWERRPPRPQLGDGEPPIMASVVASYKGRASLSRSGQADTPALRCAKRA